VEEAACAGAARGTPVDVLETMPRPLCGEDRRMSRIHERNRILQRLARRGSPCDLCDRLRVANGSRRLLDGWRDRLPNRPASQTGASIRFKGWLLFDFGRVADYVLGDGVFLGNGRGRLHRLPPL
jgi:hypothetical protein